jgi:TPR repeat protein
MSRMGIRASHHSQVPECFTGLTSTQSKKNFFLLSLQWRLETPVLHNYGFMGSSFSQNKKNCDSKNAGIPCLLEWCKIRDTFFGENFVHQNIPLALELAGRCQHPDARWLTEVCAGKGVTTKEDAKRVFSALGQNDARALCFSWLSGTLDEKHDLTPLRRSAELGFAFAQAWMSGWTEGKEAFEFAQLAAAQGERDGFYALGWCFLFCKDVQRDQNKAKENFLLASELGEVWSMAQVGDLLDELDEQRWYWWGRAAACRVSRSFVHGFVKHVELFKSGSGSAAVMFAIGRALQGHVNEDARTIFNFDDDFASCIGPAKQAIAFYQTQIKGTKEAMYAWTQVGIHFNIVKDVRRLIAKLIWDSRDEALYMSLYDECVIVDQKDD